MVALLRKENERNEDRIRACIEGQVHLLFCPWQSVLWGTKTKTRYADAMPGFSSPHPKSKRGKGQIHDPFPAQKPGAALMT